MYCLVTIYWDGSIIIDQSEEINTPVKILDFIEKFKSDIYPKSIVKERCIGILIEKNNKYKE